MQGQTAGRSAPCRPPRAGRAPPAHRAPAAAGPPPRHVSARSFFKGFRQDSKSAGAAPRLRSRVTTAHTATHCAPPAQASRAASGATTLTGTTWSTTSTTWAAWLLRREAGGAAAKPAQARSRPHARARLSGSAAPRTRQGTYDRMYALLSGATARAGHGERLGDACARPLAPPRSPPRFASPQPASRPSTSSCSSPRPRRTCRSWRRRAAACRAGG